MVIKKGIRFKGGLNNINESERLKWGASGKSFLGLSGQLFLRIQQDTKIHAGTSRNDK